MKKRVFEILELQRADDKVSRVITTFLIGLVLLNVVAVIIATEDSIGVRYRVFFNIFELFSICVFTAEYALRLWSCGSSKKFRGWRGHIRYALSPLALLDLIVILPFYLPLLIPLDLRFLRIVRVLRAFRLLKLTRYSPAYDVIRNVLQEKKEELVIALASVFTLLVLASSIMYVVEHDAQPEVFSSIPAAMWWGVVTLTTVGYGDIYPVTVLGKFCASLIALLSIGLFALPAGILASGFGEATRQVPSNPDLCPHCGKHIEDSLQTNPAPKQENSGVGE